MLSVHLICLQHVRRDAARRAGSSATADPCCRWCRLDVGVEVPGGGRFMEQPEPPYSYATVATVICARNLNAPTITAASCVLSILISVRSRS